MKATRRTQPYRSGAREPSSALDAMRAGKAGPHPGAALMAASKKSPGKKPKIMIPRW